MIRIRFQLFQFKYLLLELFLGGFRVFLGLGASALGFNFVNGESL